MAEAGASAEDVLARLFQETYAPLVRLAYVMTSDNGLAEEIVQEAFVQTWRAWSRIRDVDAVASYVRSAVVNRARSVRRRRLYEARVSRMAHSVTDHDSGGRLDLDRLLLRLPGRQRACVVLRYYEDLSEAETARLLGVSVGTVKSQTHKALRRLHAALGGEM